MSTTVSRLDVAGVRRDFPILHKPLPKGMLPVYLDSAASAQKPRQVIEKERECLESYYANAYRGVYRFGARVSDELDATRRKVQEFLGAAAPEEIIFTSGCTMSINLVANAWGRKFLQAGDEILLNEMEHHANLVPWQRIAAERGAVLRFVPLTPDGQLDLQQLDDVLTERTKLVAVTGMSNVLGTVPPVDVLAAKAHERGALILVDAAQSVPHLPTDVQYYSPLCCLKGTAPRTEEWETRRRGEGEREFSPPLSSSPAFAIDPYAEFGVNRPSTRTAGAGAYVDFLAFSGHKLFGPTGVGILYARRELLEAMDPFLGGGHMISRVYKDRSEYAEPPARFEAGTLPIVQAIALGTAVDYVTGLGFGAIHEHEQRLLRDAHEKLLAIPGLTIYGPGVEHKGAIVSFGIEKAHPEDLANLLDVKGVFVRHGHHCTMPLHDLLGVPATVRASFSIYNTEAEIDALAEALQFARKRLRLA
jgi:cysteine desulfurase/selenocysteine lyase